MAGNFERMYFVPPFRVARPRFSGRSSQIERSFRIQIAVRPIGLRIPSHQLANTVTSLRERVMEDSRFAYKDEDGGERREESEERRVESGRKRRQSLKWVPGTLSLRLSVSFFLLFANSKILHLYNKYLHFSGQATGVHLFA